MEDRKFNILFSCSAFFAAIATLNFAPSEPSGSFVIHIGTLLIVFLIFFIVPQTLVAVLDVAADSFSGSSSLFGKAMWLLSKVSSITISAVIIAGGIIGFIVYLSKQ